MIIKYLWNEKRRYAVHKKYISFKAQIESSAVCGLDKKIKHFLNLAEFKKQKLYSIL